MIFNWQIIPRHMFVQPLQDKVLKLPSQDSIEQWFCLSQHLSSSLWLQWELNSLAKVEKGLGHISSTGSCFIILTGKSVWQLSEGGGGGVWHLWGCCWFGCYGYLLVPSNIPSISFLDTSSQAHLSVMNLISQQMAYIRCYVYFLKYISFPWRF